MDNKKKILITSECVVSGGRIARVGDILEVDKSLFYLLKSAGRGDEIIDPEPVTEEIPEEEVLPKTEGEGSAPADPEPSWQEEIIPGEGNLKVQKTLTPAN